MNRFLKLALAATALAGAIGLAGCKPDENNNRPDIVIVNPNNTFPHHHRPDIVIVPPAGPRLPDIVIAPSHRNRDDNPPVIIPSKRRPSVVFGNPNGNDDPPVVIPHK